MEEQAILDILQSIASAIKWCAMHYLSLFVSFLGLASAGFGQPSASSYASSEGPIAKSGVLANIGPSGAKCQGASSGVVVASPSTTNPDYVYTWVRDSSLVFKMLIDQFTTGADTSLRSLIDSFVTAESALQQTQNPSGTISTGGLGEPKFNIDLTAFTGPWGRPQRGRHIRLLWYLANLSFSSFKTVRPFAPPPWSPMRIG